MACSTRYRRTSALMKWVRCLMLAFRWAIIWIHLTQTTFFWYTKSKKSHGFKSKEWGLHVVVEGRLMVLSSLKLALNNCFTRVVICDEATTYMSIVRSSYWNCWNAKRIWIRKSASYCLHITVQLMGHTGVIASKNNGPTINAAVIRHQKVHFSERRGLEQILSHLYPAFWAYTERFKWKRKYRIFHDYLLSTSIRQRSCTAKDYVLKFFMHFWFQHPC